MQRTRASALPPAASAFPKNDFRKRTIANRAPNAILCSFHILYLIHRAVQQTCFVCIGKLKTTLAAIGPDKVEALLADKSSNPIIK